MFSLELLRSTNILSSFRHCSGQEREVRARYARGKRRARKKRETASSHFLVSRFSPCTPAPFQLVLLLQQQAKVLKSGIGYLLKMAILGEEAWMG